MFTLVLGVLLLKPSFHPLHGGLGISLEAEEHLQYFIFLFFFFSDYVLNVQKITRNNKLP